MKNRVNIFLYFLDKTLEQEYHEWKLPSRRMQIRFISLLTGLLYMLAFQIDKYIVSGEALDLMMLFHLYLLPVILFTISILSFWKKFYNKMIFILVIAPMIATVGNLLIVTTLVNYTIYLTEIYLIIFWTLTISGLRLFHALISVFFILICATTFLYKIPHNIFVMHLFWMFSSLSFGLVSAYIFERLNKKVFLNYKELEKLSVSDKLTGLLNRTKLNEVVQNEVLQCKRFEHTFGLAIIDIDHFKSVNDNYGHQVGDEVLVKIANIIKENLRTTDILFRWGGEEFVVVCLEANKNGVMVLVENIRKKIEEHIFEKIGTKTVSIGFTMYEENDDDDTLVKKADDALYRAKNAGRNRIEFE